VKNNICLSSAALCLVIISSSNPAGAADLTAVPTSQIGSPIKSDIASLGFANANRAKVPYFELSMVADIPIAPVTVPSLITVGPVDVVTPESFPNVVSKMIGKEVMKSAPLSKLVDAAKAVASGVADDFKALIAANTPANVFVSNPVVGSILTTSGGIKAVGSQLSSGNAVATFTEANTYLVANGYAKISIAPDGRTWYWSGSLMRFAAWPGAKYSSNPDRFNTDFYNTAYAGASPTPITTAPGSTNTAAIASAMPTWLGTNSDEIVALMQAENAASLAGARTTDAPVTAANPAPPNATGITQGDLDKWFAQNTAAVAKAAADAALAAANGDPANSATAALAAQAALEAAKAAADAQKGDPAGEEDGDDDENFSGVTPSGFEAKFDPGEFDIPARFTTFVNTVKASPLFSFSSGFFNSLPGGGSPIYEIEAGQYGRHTIDFSQTMSGGLAVMKTVLLMVFGFFSIRAVIMKR